MPSRCGGVGPSSPEAGRGLTHGPEPDGGRGRRWGRGRDRDSGLEWHASSATEEPAPGRRPAGRWTPGLLPSTLLPGGQCRGGRGGGLGVVGRSAGAGLPRGLRFRRRGGGSRPRAGLRREVPAAWRVRVRAGRRPGTRPRSECPDAPGGGGGLGRSRVETGAGRECGPKGFEAEAKPGAGEVTGTDRRRTESKNDPGASLRSERRLEWRSAGDLM